MNTRSFGLLNRSRYLEQGLYPQLGHLSSCRNPKFIQRVLLSSIHPIFERRPRRDRPDFRRSFGRGTRPLRLSESPPPIIDSQE